MKKDIQLIYWYYFKYGEFSDINDIAFQIYWWIVEPIHPSTLEMINKWRRK